MLLHLRLHCTHRATCLMPVANGADAYRLKQGVIGRGKLRCSSQERQTLPLFHPVAVEACLKSSLSQVHAHSSDSAVLVILCAGRDNLRAVSRCGANVSVATPASESASRNFKTCFVNRVVSQTREILRGGERGVTHDSSWILQIHRD